MLRVQIAGVLAALALLAGGCATAYGPKNVTGGYVENWRSRTELEVRFHHNDYMTVEQARELATRRAAELALEGGYRYLRIWGSRLHRQKIAGPQYAVIQVEFLDNPAEDAVDAVKVIRDTDAMAGGKLSSGAREKLRSLAADAAP